MWEKTSLLLALMSLMAVVNLKAEETYPLSKEGFIYDWLIAGPYPSEVVKESASPLGFKADMLMNFGGEANIEPYPGMKDKALFKADFGRLAAGETATNAWGFRVDRSFDIEWKELHADKTREFISLDGRFGEIADYLAAFAACYVVSPEDRQAIIKLGSDDDYKLYVNHELAGELAIARGCKPDQNTHTVKLKKGFNTILLKINDRLEGHAFCLRILDMKGKPFSDLSVVLANPRTEFAKKCRNIGVVDDFDNEVFAKMRLGEAPLFLGKHELDVMIGNKTPVNALVELLLRDPMGATVFEGNIKTGLVAEKAYSIKKTVECKEPGEYALLLAVKDAGTRKSLGNIEKKFKLISVEGVKARKDDIEKKYNELLVNKNELDAKFKDISEKVAAVRADIAKQYEQVENSYAENHKKLYEKYGKAGRSISKPFAPAKTGNAVLCLNGDNWEIAAAVKKGDGLDDENPPSDASAWVKHRVPSFGIEKYYRAYYLPMERESYVESNDAVTKKCALDWRLPQQRIADGIWWKTKFNMPDNWQGERIFLKCETVDYLVKVYLNGQYCGNYKGWTGVMNIDLTDAIKKGENLLEIYTGRPRLYEIRRRPFQYCDIWGLMGDLRLEAVPEVFVEDTWIIPSYRNASLTVKTWVHNKSKEKKEVVLSQSCVLNGVTCLNVGTQKVVINPGEIKELEINHPWTDAKLWGIGGKYGDPVLYHLASTITEGDRVLDQHFDRFGFREFWKEGFHFYLNGKRIFLQGVPVQFTEAIGNRQWHTIFCQLMRQMNFNTLRLHCDFKQGEISKVADELGMLVYAQMYPSGITDTDFHFEQGRSKHESDVLSPLSEWIKTEKHKENKLFYSNWVKWLRNHPSVIMYSTDNEIFTQAWDVSTPEKLAANINRDKIAALYAQHVKSLDPTRIVTRDGDQGTWGKMGKWQESPPAEVANYHYPEWGSKGLIENWESAYEGRPVIFGETFACATWSGRWNDATPLMISNDAVRLRKFLSKYRELEIPAFATWDTCFFMDPLKPEGSTPWKITPKMWADFKENKVCENMPHFPYFPIKWPSYSGESMKTEFHRWFSITGTFSINWFDENFPTHVNTGVNDAYRESMNPMPPLAKNRAPEVLFTVTSQGKALPNTMVFLEPLEGQAIQKTGVLTDSAGTAWFVLSETGKYMVSVDGNSFKKEVKISPLPLELKAGFGYLPRVELEVE